MLVGGLPRTPMRYPLVFYKTAKFQVNYTINKNVIYTSVMDEFLENIQKSNSLKWDEDS